MNYEIVESFSQMVKEKGIDRDQLIAIIEDIFGSMVKKKYGVDANFDVVVNMDKGDIEIYLLRTVVEKVENPTTEIDLATAQEKSGEPLEIGDEFAEIIDLQSFGRRLIIQAKQSLNQKIKELERDIIYEEYSENINEIVVGEIYQIKGNKDILVNHNRCELLLPRSEQIQKEKYKKGDTIRAIIKEVNKSANSPMVIISRSDPNFLKKLFEIEIPEIYDGIIEIKGVAREPGERAKVAVESHDDRIDAVGACVGMKGVRIHAIVRELNNENIDIINYSDEPETYITRALAPGKINKIEVDKHNKIAKVWADEEQASLIIGKNGQNIKLATQLTGYEIDVIREEKKFEVPEDDIDLAEFKDELGEEGYIKISEAGFKTASDIINARGKKKEFLIEVLGSKEELNAIIEIMKKEFEDE
ncbi:MAG TPA: transcription termination factor NusA [Bacteroidota bacterium]|jgi:N utilization substance protein A|nr:transcription termination factor NusA [Bacteroidota bacterium]